MNKKKIWKSRFDWTWIVWFEVTATYIEFEDTKGAIRMHKSKYDIQYNNQKYKQWSIKHHTEN